MSLLYVLVPLVLYLVHWYRNRRLALTLLKRHGIDGPEPSLVFGNMSEINTKKNVPRMKEWHAKYGDVVGYYMGSSASIAIKDPELLKLIQIKDFNNFHSRRMLLKGGFDCSERNESMLIAQKGKRWKEVRSVLTPTFNASKMKQSVPLINDAIDALLENVKEKSAGGDSEFDIYEMYQGLTMDTIGRSAFGIRTDVQRNPNDRFLQAAKAVFNTQLTKFRHLPTLFNLWFPEWTPVIYPIRWLQARILDALDWSVHGHLYNVCEQIISQRRKNIEDKDNPWSRHDLLQQMLEAKMSNEQMQATDSDQLAASVDKVDSEEVNGNVHEPSSLPKTSKKVHHMTDQEIAANSVLFFEAGYETTSTALGFVTHLLVNNQDVQDRVREELNELFERTGKFDYNTVTELQYMEAVIFESMRIFPPITMFVSRTAENDYKYKNITIPANTGIIASVYELHHDPRLWDEPEKFDPERFLGVNKGKINPVAWQPFGCGPRNCIGMRFALLEAKLALARLLIKYTLVAGPSTEVELEVDYKPISMTPKKGVFVRAIPI